MTTTAMPATAKVFVLGRATEIVRAQPTVGVASCNRLATSAVDCGRFVGSFCKQAPTPSSQIGGTEAGSPAKNCTNRAIPDWPTAQIRTSVRPTPAQEASLDALQNAAAKAKDVSGAHRR